LAPEIDRGKVLDEFRRNEISAVHHYVPLHSSPAGMRHGRQHGDLTITDRQSTQLLRLPLSMSLSQDQQERVVEVLKSAISQFS
jgi:dTDP-4-amino-4,6-dideoxygalactose transaminase